MTTYEDLTDYEYSASVGPMQNVGWLGKGIEFRKGAMPKAARDHLVELVAESPQNVTRGLHDCELCDVESPIAVDAPRSKRGVAFLGNAEVHVRLVDGRVLAAPTLIVHYIDAHDYLPPDEFVRALLLKPN